MSLYPGTFVTECKRTERRATRTLILLSGLRSEEQRNRLARGIRSLLSPSQVSPSLLQHFQSGSVIVTPEQHDNVMYIALQSIVIVLCLCHILSKFSKPFGLTACEKASALDVNVISVQKLHELHTPCVPCEKRTKLSCASQRFVVSRGNVPSLIQTSIFGQWLSAGESVAKSEDGRASGTWN